MLPHHVEKEEDDDAENGQRERHGNTTAKGNPLQVQRRRGQGEDGVDLPSDGCGKAAACRAEVGRKGEQGGGLAAGGGESYICIEWSKKRVPVYKKIVRDRGSIREAGGDVGVFRAGMHGVRELA